LTDSDGSSLWQFTPVSEGYVFYPSRKAGGKLLTVDEHEKLVADWQLVARRARRWTTVGAVLSAVLLWTILSQALRLPDWTNWAMVTLSVTAISGRLLWAAFAPWRLVGSRPDHVPRRPDSLARRDERSAIKWPFAILILGANAAIFTSKLLTAERSFSRWAWLIGSGAFLVLYSWLAIRKFRDRKDRTE
jgi:hypothetical protein